jgi:prepilin-type N-terminal cleavage/methylation domain-containing protein
MWRSIIRRTSSDSGFTLIELLVASVLGSLLLVGIGTFLISSMNSQVFTSAQSATVNDARNAMQQIEKEIRGANSIQSCTPLGSPAGSCLQMDGQKPTDGPPPNTRAVKYSFASSALTRQVFDPAANTWGAGQMIVDRVANTALQPVFVCDTAGSFLTITVDLHLAPTPHSNPTYDVRTSVRPRNFPQAAVCV